MNILLISVLQCETKEDSDAEINLHIPCWGSYDCSDCPCIQGQCQCSLKMEAEQKLETLLHISKKNSHDNNN